MSMKPVMNEPFGTVGNAETQPSKRGHYDSVGNAITNNAATGNPNPANAGAQTTQKGPVPGA